MAPAVAGTGGAATSTGGAAGGSSGTGSRGSAGAAGGANAGFVDLFNGTDLTGFNTYKATSAANNAPGMLLAAAEAEKVFKPENGMIHVHADAADQSTQVHYLLQTVSPLRQVQSVLGLQVGHEEIRPHTDLGTYPRPRQTPATSS